MRYFLLLPILFFLFESVANGQRSTRRPPSPITINYPDTFAGRYFSVTLSNNDTVPILLKLGPTSQIGNNDTLYLTRTYPCSNPSLGEYYDLHDLASWENSCISWYTLQLIKPKGTIRFVVKLKDFDKANTSRLYFCYTREIKAVDRELDLYTDRKKIYVQKEGRDFKTGYVTVSKHASNSDFAIGWPMEH